MSLYIGTRIRVSFELYNELVDPPTLVDPDAIEVRVSAPRQRDQVFVWPGGGPIVRDGMGRFYFEFTFQVSGEHRVRVAAMGAVAAVERTSLCVQE